MKIRIKTILLCSFFALSFSNCCGGHQADNNNGNEAIVVDQANPWKAMGEVEKSIEQTNFPTKTFNIVTDYQAIAGEDVSDIIRRAISDCHRAGGGRVVIPAGEYYTKAIHLLSNVNLHLEKGATLKFSTIPTDYAPQVPTRWEGIDCMGMSPLIYAYRQENIAVTGEGILDGQASWENWWKLRARTSAEDKAIGKFMGKEKLHDFEKHVTSIADRIFTENDELRPQFIQFYQCNRILIEGVTLNNAPFWLLHPLMSKNIVVRGVTLDSHGPNNDGCDPESCENVLIENCVFNTGDDCIAIKSGRNNDGRAWSLPSRNIIVRNCQMKDGHAGVAIGSEISGSCYNVWMENCQIGSPEMDRPFRIKSNAIRGGVVSGFYIRNINISECKQAVLKLELKYEKVTEGPYYPLFENILLENITCQKSRYGIWIDGLEDHICVKNVTLKNCQFNGITDEKVNSIVGAEGISFHNSTFNGQALSSVGH
jgi:polygalacturonase